MTETAKGFRDYFRSRINAGRQMMLYGDEMLPLLNDADRLARTESLLREARTVISMAANDANDIRRTHSGSNAAAAAQRRDKAWAVEAKIDRILED